MNTGQKNEGIVISGGSINAHALAVGKGAKAVSTNTNSASGNDSSLEPGPETPEDVLLMNVLRDTLLALFNESELRDLCFQLGVDYDTLSGQSKPDKTRELLLYLSRHGRLNELIKVGQDLRPHGNWTQPEKTADPE